MNTEPVSGGAGFLDQVTVLVLTWNEEANLARTLGALAAFPRVVVLDSGSTDATADIAARHPNTRICVRGFDQHAAQWNHGLQACGIETDWVLALDADYVLTDEAAREIAALQPAADVDGYSAGFRYCIEGRPLHGSLYPPTTVLFRRAGARYRQDGHTQRLQLAGRVLPLKASILHDDRKSLSAWLAAQDRYAILECRLLLATRWADLSWRDRLRRSVVVTPWLVPLYCLTIGRGLLDGRHGLYYALQRGIAEAILSARLVHARLLDRDT